MENMLSEKTPFISPASRLTQKAGRVQLTSTWKVFPTALTEVLRPGSCSSEFFGSVRKICASL